MPSGLFRMGLRLFALWLAATSLLGARQARAGWIEEQDGKTVIHIVLYSLPDPSDPAVHVQADVQVVNAFRERFARMFRERYRQKYQNDPQTYGQRDWDNIEVRLHKFTGIEVEGVETDLLAIAGGMAPDVLYINFRKSDNYIRNNFLYPLDKPEDGYLVSMPQEEIDARIHDRFWPVIRRRGPSGDEHVWAVPSGGALGKVLLFRKDLFDQANLAYPDKDWTWDDMLAAAKKLTDPAKGTYGLLLGSGKHESWHWITFLWSAGGDVMQYDPQTGEWSCVFDSPEAVTALDYYTRICTEKWIDADGTIRRGYAFKDAAEANTKWDRGQIGMQLGYIDEKLFATINPEVTGMVPVPKGPDGQRGGELNSRMMGLYAGIQDPAVRDAAWEYMRFFDSEDANRIRTKVMVEGGLGQFVNPKYLRQFGYPEIERLSPKGWAETFDIAIATGQPEPYGKNSNVAYDLMTYPIQEAEQLALKDQLPEEPAARRAALQDLLDRACARANEEMIGIVPPDQRMRRRVVAVVVLLAILVSYVLVFRRISRAFTPPTVAGQEQKKWAFGRYAWAYLLLVPAALTILLWQYVPLIRGSVMAFYDYKLLGESLWVGVDNFGDVLYDGFWWNSVYNALRYSFLVLSMTFLPPVILAILLQEVPRGTVLFRTVYYLPAVVTGLVTVLMWKQFYDPSDQGVLNSLILRIPAVGFIAIGLALFGICFAFARRLWLHKITLPAWGFVVAGVLLFATVADLASPVLLPQAEDLATSLAQLPSRLFSTTAEPYRWLRDPEMAMMAIVIPMVWAGMGPGCLIYLAALKGIPDDYYEAAEIDGANFIDKILFVVFPTIKSLVIINFVGAFIASWYTSTGNILVMTGGGANTEVVGLHIWYKAFTYLKFGPATAMAWLLGFMLIGFTVHQLQILSRVEFRAAGRKE